MNAIEEKLLETLKDEIGDAERVAQARELIAAVCDVLDQADATADDVVQAVEASLGSFLAEAEQSVAVAERVVKVTP